MPHATLRDRKIFVVQLTLENGLRGIGKVPMEWKLRGNGLRVLGSSGLDSFADLGQVLLPPGKNVVQVEKACSFASVRNIAPNSIHRQRKPLDFLQQIKTKLQDGINTPEAAVR